MNRLENLEKMVQAGELGAVVELAQLLTDGSDGAPKDVARAKRLYEHAITEGDSAAMNDLAVILESGNDVVAKDAKRAVSLYERAVEYGNVVAMCNFADLLERGDDGVEKDAARAKSLYELAITKGYSSAMNRLALMLENGNDVVAKDAKRAVSLYERAIECGNVVAMCNFANLLKRGDDGVEKDAVRAKRLYERCVQAGDVIAMFELGDLLHLGGDGVGKDHLQAKKFYESAVKAGDIPAMNNLGFLLAFDGVDAVKDTKRAMALFERAIQGGNTAAFNNLGKLLADGAEGVAKDLKRAKDLLEHAVNQGYVKSMAHLGDLLRTGGDGVEKDVLQAKQLYERSVAGGSEKGMYRLAVLLESGDTTVAKDLKRAKELYELAAERGHTEAKKAVARIRGTSEKEDLPAAFGRALVDVSVLDQSYVLAHVRSEHVKTACDLLAGHNLILLSIRAGLITGDSVRTLGGTETYLEDNLYIPGKESTAENAVLTSAILRQAESLGIISSRNVRSGGIQTDMRGDENEVDQVMRALADRVGSAQDLMCRAAGASALEGRVNPLGSTLDKLSMNDDLLKESVLRLSQSLTQLRTSIQEMDSQKQHAAIAKCVLWFVRIVGDEKDNAACSITDLMVDFSAEDVASLGAGVKRPVAAQVAHMDLGNYQVSRHLFSNKALAKLGSLKRAAVIIAICDSAFQSLEGLQTALQEQSSSSWHLDRPRALLDIGGSPWSTHNGPGRAEASSCGDAPSLDMKAREYYRYLTNATERGLLSFATSQREVNRLLLGCEGIAAESPETFEHIFFELADEDADEVTEEVFVGMFAAAREKQERNRQMEKLMEECAIRFRQRAHPDTVLSMRLAARVWCNLHNEMVARGFVEGSVKEDVVVEEMRELGRANDGVKEEEFVRVAKRTLEDHWMGREGSERRCWSGVRSGLPQWMTALSVVAATSCIIALICCATDGEVAEDNVGNARHRFE